MLVPKISQCKECPDIQPLIDEINCKVFELSKKLYNNIVFSLNLHIDYIALQDLLHYRRILEYKLVNTEYACNYSIDMIASKVKLLKYK
jgi:hypothetical protein